MMEKKEKGDSYTHILKYTGIFGFVQGLNILISVVRNKLVALILGPEGMGLMSLFNSTIRVVSDSTNLGVSMSAVRNISEAYGQGDGRRLEHVVIQVRTWSLLTALLGAMLCITLSPQLNKWTFDWGDHTLHFIFLSPVVALTAITGGELAILKGTRHLSRLAMQSVYGVIGALVTSIPLYLVWNERAVVPSLIIIALVQFLSTVIYSYRLYPLRLRYARACFGEGLNMVKVGIAFVASAIIESSAEFIIRSFLNNTADLSTVGLYNAGYMMTMTYAGMVFQAMETDYYPRLSCVKGTGTQLNEVVNHQIEASLLLVSPLLVAFIISAPILLPLLYSDHFQPVVDMMKLALLAMYIRAIDLPIEYLPLSKGDSRTYIAIELTYGVTMVGAVLTGYHFFGLTGAGAGILLTGAINLMASLALTRLKYGYRLSRCVILYTLIHFPIGCLAFVLTLFFQGAAYWTGGVVLVLTSFAVSVKILRSKSHLWESIIKKVKAKFGRMTKATESNF